MHPEGDMEFHVEGVFSEPKEVSCDGNDNRRNQDVWSDLFLAVSIGTGSMAFIQDGVHYGFCLATPYIAKP